MVFSSPFEFYTQDSLPRDGRPAPGSYSLADAQTIDANRIPINPYPEEFLVHVGLSRSYFGGVDEVPAFIDEEGRSGCSSLLIVRFQYCKFFICARLKNNICFVLFLCCAEMDLFAVVKVEKPKQLTIGVRPRRENEQPLLEAAAGRLTVFAAAGPEDSPPLLVTPVLSVAPVVEPAHVEEVQAASSDSVEILRPEVVAQNLKRKGEASSSGTSKRWRHVVSDEESSAGDEMVAAGVGKETAEASPPP